MNAGRRAPRHQAMAMLYPRSKELRNSLYEYFIVVVRLCHHVLGFTRKSTISRLISTTAQAELDAFRAGLDTWSGHINDEIILLQNQLLCDTATEQGSIRRLLVGSWEEQKFQKRLKKRLNFLDRCSTYSYMHPWKQIRKRGTTSLFASNAGYQTWKDSYGPSVLAILGKLGAGKSVTVANLVDQLHLEKKNVVYFFCRHDIAQSLSAREILGSIVRQCISLLPTETADVLVNTLYASSSPTLLDSDALADILMLPSIQEETIYLLLDGLDECDRPDWEILSDYLQKLQGTTSWKLCLSARTGTEDVFENLQVKHKFLIPEDSPDISRYIESEFERRIANNSLALSDERLRGEIRNALEKHAKGM